MKKLTLLLIFIILTDIMNAQCPIGSKALSGSGNITINAGQSYCIAKGSSYTGSISLNGGTLTNNGVCNPSSFNFNGGTLTNIGSCKFGSSILINTGACITNNAGSTISITGSLNINSKGIINNSGTISVSSSSSNNGTIINAGLLSYNGAYNSNTNSVITNTGNFTINGSYINNAIVTSSGNFNINGTLTNNSNASITISGGNVIITGSSTNNSSITNSGTCTMLQGLSNGGTFTNTTLGTTTITGNVTNNKQITNAGYFETTSSFTNNSGSSLSNSGFIKIDANLQNSGSISNSQTIRTTGNITNNNGATIQNTLYIIAQGSFINNAILNNTGTINSLKGTLGTNPLVLTQGDIKILDTLGYIDANNRVSAIINFNEPSLFTKSTKKIANTYDYQNQFNTFKTQIQFLMQSAGITDINKNFLIKQTFSKTINAISAKIPLSLYEQIKHLPNVASVTINVKLKSTLKESIPFIKADIAHKNGKTGKGVKIGIMDTGIDHDNSFFLDANNQSRVLDAIDFIQSTKDGNDCYEGAGIIAPIDDVGHGTHVAGIAAGNQIGVTDGYVGVAPEASLYDLKVLNEAGTGTIGDIVSAFEYVLDPDCNKKIDTKLVDVINMSLCTSANFLGGSNISLYNSQNLFNQIQLAIDNGIIVCIASGNNGNDFFTVSEPGSYKGAITVGAVDDANNSIAKFSGSGPAPVVDFNTSIITNYEIKPDVIAPGVNITSAQVGGGVATHDGTSMAAPHVAGLCALLKADHPDWGNAEVKSAIMSSARFISNVDVMHQGAGVIDCENALNANCLLLPASLSFGIISISDVSAWNANQTKWTSSQTTIIKNSSSIDQTFHFDASKFIFNGLNPSDIGKVSISISGSTVVNNGSEYSVFVSANSSTSIITNIIADPTIAFNYNSYSYSGELLFQNQDINQKDLHLIVAFQKATPSVVKITVPSGLTNLNVYMTSKTNVYFSCFDNLVVVHKDGLEMKNIRNSWYNNVLTIYNVTPNIYTLYVNLSDDQATKNYIKEDVEINDNYSFNILESDYMKNKIDVSTIDKNGNAIHADNLTFHIADQNSGISFLMKPEQSNKPFYFSDFGSTSNNVKVGISSYNVDLDNNDVYLTSFPVMDKILNSQTLSNTPYKTYFQNYSLEHFATSFKQNYYIKNRYIGYWGMYSDTRFKPSNKTISTDQIMNLYTSLSNTPSDIGSVEPSFTLGLEDANGKAYLNGSCEVYLFDEFRSISDLEFTNTHNSNSCTFSKGAVFYKSDFKNDNSNINFNVNMFSQILDNRVNEMRNSTIRIKDESKNILYESTADAIYNELDISNKCGQKYFTLNKTVNSSAKYSVEIENKNFWFDENHTGKVLYSTTMDLAAANPNPLTITLFNITENDIISNEINPCNALFTFGLNKSFKNAMLEVKSTSSSTWAQMPVKEIKILSTGNFISFYAKDFLPSDVYDLRFTANDLEDNTCTLTINTAFIAKDGVIPAAIDLNTNAKFCSIQKAIDAASDNDIIEIQPGTYTEKISITKPLTLKSKFNSIDASTKPFIAQTILNPLSFDTDFLFADLGENISTTNTVTIQGLTFSCKNSCEIPLSFNNISNLLLDNVVLQDNESTQSTIVVNTNNCKNITLSNITVTNINSPYCSMFNIVNADNVGVSNLKVNNCICGNLFGSNNSKNIILDNLDIENSSFYSSMYIALADNFELKNSSIKNCSFSYNCAYLYVNNQINIHNTIWDKLTVNQSYSLFNFSVHNSDLGNIFIDQCKITNCSVQPKQNLVNISSDNPSKSTVSLSNSLFFNNSADRLLVLYNALYTVNHVTLVDNPVQLAIYIYSGSITNSILWNNTNDISSYASDTKVSNCILGNPNTYNTINSNIITTQPTFIDASNGDYHLAQGSSALGKGVVSNLIVDLDNNVRPQPSGTNPDLGAYESPYFNCAAYIPYYVNITDYPYLQYTIREFSSIQAAIDDFNNQPTDLEIDVKEGVHKENISIHNKSLLGGIIMSENYSKDIKSALANTIIEPLDDNVPVITIDNSGYTDQRGNGTFRLRGITLNGHANSSSTIKNGAAINNTDCSITLDDVVISNFIANQNGGALYFDGGVQNCNVYISNCTAMNGGAIYAKNCGGFLFEGNASQNTASNNGGGIYLENCGSAKSPFDVYGIRRASVWFLGELSDQIISNNTSSNGNGGGIYAKNCYELVLNIDIKNNYAKNSGGGVYDIASVMTSSSEFIQNNAETNAAGLYLQDANAYFTQSHFMNNGNELLSNIEGGAMYLTSSTDTKYDCQFEHNQITNNIGESSIYTNNYNPKWYYNTIADNSGLIKINQTSAVSFVNSILSGNDDGIAITNSNALLVQIKNNDFYNNGTNSVSLNGSPYTLNITNINADPAFDKEKTDDLTFYKLSSTSPCIDANVNNGIGINIPQPYPTISIPGWDWNVNRVFNWNDIKSPSDPYADMGAFEYNTTMSLKSDVISNDLLLNNEMTKKDNPTTENNVISCELFPNPTKGYFTITTNDIIESIQLVSVTGIEMVKESVGRNEIRFDLSNYSNGIYAVKVILKSTTLEYKVVKQ